MVNILLSGCNGKMGQMISQCAALRDDCTIVAGLDVNPQLSNAYPVFTSPAHCDLDVHVIIDFSHPSVLAPLLDYALARRIPAVIATTGLSPQQIRSVQDAAATIPIFFSANMSLGVNLLCALVKKAASILGGDFDIEIIEKHHNLKIDAPSGTALMLADEIATALPFPPVYTYDRHSHRKKRDKREIGIHAVRGGSIVGEHEVLFAGGNECLSLTHTAHSKEVFATGSINAALFLARQKPGLYAMKDLL